MTEHIYIAPEHPTFSFKFFRNGKKEIIQFARGELHTEDEELVEFIDNLIATRPQFSSVMRKVDREAAIELAKKFQAEYHSGSMTGPMSAADVAAQARKQLDARDAVMENMDPEARRNMNEQIAKDSIAMTEGVDVVEQPLDADIAKPAEEVAKSTKPASTKMAFAALANSKK